MTGESKSFSYDPPGAIGLLYEPGALLLRFDEATTAQRPQDAGGLLADLDVVDAATALVMPPAVDGACGRARSFAAGRGLCARDIDSGSTLFTRDMTIQAILKINVPALAALGQPGVLVARGADGSGAEYIAYALTLNITNAATRTAAIQWGWSDTGGGYHPQPSVNFTVPLTGFMMLTSTRRWVSPTEVETRHYIGDVLIDTTFTGDGSIGGGTTGLMQIGFRHDAGVPNFFLVATVDELLVVGREMCLQEIEATWLRITNYQPRGEAQFIELHDPGFPLSTDTGTDVRRETRLIGQALGFAGALVENMRANMLPQRAYGATLDDWEEAARVVPRPLQNIDARRDRVVSRLRQRQGSSPDGLRAALRDLIGGADVSELEFIAFDNTIRDDFSDPASPLPLRWASSSGTWSNSAGALRAAPGGSVDYTMDGTSRLWKRCATPVQGDGRAAHFLCKLAVTAPQVSNEFGVFFGDAGLGNWILFGLRDAAGTHKLVYERFAGNVSSGVVDVVTLGANPAAIWLHLYQDDATGTWKAAYSLTSGTGPWVGSPASIAHVAVQNQAGMYMRTTSGGSVTAAAASFDDAVMRQPFGTRPMNAYVFLDADGLGVSPDSAGARAVVAAVKHAFIDGTFTTRRALLAGDPESRAGETPLGGY